MAKGQGRLFVLSEVGFHIFHVFIGLDLHGALWDCWGCDSVRDSIRISHSMYVVDNKFDNRVFSGGTTSITHVVWMSIVAGMVLVARGSCSRTTQQL